MVNAWEGERAAVDGCTRESTHGTMGESRGPARGKDPARAVAYRVSDFWFRFSLLKYELVAHIADTVYYPQALSTHGCVQD